MASSHNLRYGEFQFPRSFGFTQSFRAGGSAHALAGGGRWIQGAIRHPGALHRQLGVPQGQKISAAKLAKAVHSNNPTLRRRANLAETLKGFH
jgi:hypothetical protein